MEHQQSPVHAAASALAAQNAQLRADNERLRHAVEVLIGDNESLETGFEILLDKLQGKAA